MFVAKTLNKNAETCDKEGTEKGQDLKGQSRGHTEVTRIHAEDADHQKS